MILEFGEDEIFFIYLKGHSDQSALSKLRSVYLESLIRLRRCECEIEL